MRIESLSIRAVTILIIAMIGGVAVVLSWMAGNYFRQAALEAQMNSLSRVIEVAAQEMLREAQQHTFDLGMKMGNSGQLARALNNADDAGGARTIVSMLDDPFVSGFAGFSNINLEKLRVYDPELNIVAESSRGVTGLAPALELHLADAVRQRRGVDRLKTIHALWISPLGPLHSTLVPIGGLRMQGYLEVIINPAFNLPDIGNITRTPVSIFSMRGEQIAESGGPGSRDHLLPIEYIMLASDGQEAFRIVGYENVERLNATMERTQWVTIAGFLLLSTVTLLLALWLFNRFLFVPFRQLVLDMKRMANGELDVSAEQRGLRDFTVLAETFDAMARQVKLRTGDLERLLDMDDSAILCFAGDRQLVYANLGAARLFGYTRDELADHDLAELFIDDVPALPGTGGERDGGARPLRRRARLQCVGKGGETVPVDAIISPLTVQGGQGHVMVMNAVTDGPEAGHGDGRGSDQERQRIEAVEQSLNSLLEIAATRPALMSGSMSLERLSAGGGQEGHAKSALCAQVVGVMHAALACWEQDLGQGKLDLAERSRIWPVYIDKSTPTTRTLDRYLKLDTCPRNPRAQRVIDTAEFVLRQTPKRDTPARKRLQHALEQLRLMLTGMK
jgi:PAS domain S-box-containing protein